MEDYKHSERAKRYSKSKISNRLKEKYSLLIGERTLDEAWKVLRYDRTAKVKIPGRSLITGRKRVVLFSYTKEPPSKLF